MSEPKPPDLNRIEASPRFQFSLRGMLVLSSFAGVMSWATATLMRIGELDGMSVPILILLGSIGGTLYGLAAGRTRDITILASAAGAISVWLTICILADQLYDYVPWPRHVAVFFLSALGIGLISIPAVAIGSFSWQLFHGKKEEH